MLNKNKHKGIFSPSDEYMHFSGLVIGVTGTHTKEDTSWHGHALIFRIYLNSCINSPYSPPVMPEGFLGTKQHAGNKNPSLQMGELHAVSVPGVSEGRIPSLGQLTPAAITGLCVYFHIWIVPSLISSGTKFPALPQGCKSSLAKLSPGKSLSPCVDLSK